MLLDVHPASVTASAGNQTAHSSRTWIRNGLVGILATLLIAICAHISIVLPFTSIPFTMQTFAVLLLAMALEPLVAMGVLLLYLAEGAVGLPVFSPYGLGGWAQLFGPSGGYLLSYPLAALLAGTLFSAARRYLPVFLASFGAAVLADLVILCAGAVWLGNSLHVSFGKSFELWVLPFLAIEGVKTVLVASTTTALQNAKRVS